MTHDALIRTISPTGRKVLCRLLDGDELVRGDVHPAALEALMSRGLVKHTADPDVRLRLNPTGRDVALQLAGGRP